MLAAIRIHMTYFNFIGLQLFWFAICLGITKRLLKFSWVKSLWISTGFAFIATILFTICTLGYSLDWNEWFSGFLPMWIVALPLIIRTLVSCFADIDDSGNVNSAERQRTLEMVEQGKISSEEGTELLDALGRSNAMLGQDKFSKLDMLILAGVAIAVLGFFLPWVEISIPNLAQFRSQQMGTMPNPLDSIIKSINNSRSGIAYQSGYHTGAIGWAVLIVAVLAAVPVFITPKNFLYKISMLQIFLLLLGSALVISLLYHAGSRFRPGLPICLVGFVLALFACFSKFKKLSA